MVSFLPCLYLNQQVWEGGGGSNLDIRAELAGPGTPASDHKEEENINISEAVLNPEVILGSTIF